MARHTRRARQLITLSIKVPRALSARVTKLARARKSTVSAVVRDALDRYTPRAGVSFAAAAKELLGSVEGGPGDLSTNPKHLEAFGR